MANDDGVVGHQNLLDQQTDDALALINIKCTGIGAQAREEGGQGLGQTQHGGAVGDLIDDGLQFRSQALLALPQFGHAATQVVQRQEIFLVGGYQPFHVLADPCQFALQPLLAPAGRLGFPAGRQAAIEFGGDQARVFKEAHHLGPDHLVKQVLTDRTVVTERPVQATVGIGPNAAIVVDFAR
jgi:hypothetical protein